MKEQQKKGAELRDKLYNIFKIDEQIMKCVKNLEENDKLTATKEELEEYYRQEQERESHGDNLNTTQPELEDYQPSEPSIKEKS